MMKAAVVEKFGEPLVIKQVPIPKPTSSEVLVKMITSGVCHTDLHAASGDWPVKPKCPFIPGHEGLGKIVELGENVKHLKIGDTVGIPWLNRSCCHCEFCLTGKETLCPYQLNSGYSINGSFAEYAVIPGDFAIPVPEGLDPVTTAPVFCAGVTTYKALKVSKVKPGEWVSIVGVGGLGHMAVQYAKAMGMKVIGVVPENDPSAALAKELGCDLVYDGPGEKSAEWIIEKTNGGVQGSVVTAVAKKPFDQAFASLKRGGTLVPVGIPPDVMTISIFESVVLAKEIIGSIVGTRMDLIESLDFAKCGKATTKVSMVKRLEDINQIFDDMKNNKLVGRVVIDYRN